MAATVYVTHETNFASKPYDFSLAEKYGTVEFVTRNDVNNMKNSLENKALVREIRMRLHKFDPDRDFVLIAGSPYVTALMFLILGARKIRKVKFLRWSNRDRLYTPVTIDLYPGVEVPI